eukprot:TRINITY_DN10882_c0_g1_i2.p1 TRINITY_DN10882_c0_g1~~TRINITY_DN10882_c0_g1_i2.p1  ORF type:complete len:414 (-),score=70.57 TRINITY_DN10882_c0_g1_i2:180-1421(-)
MRARACYGAGWRGPQSTPTHASGDAAGFEHARAPDIHHRGEDMYIKGRHGQGYYCCALEDFRGAAHSVCRESRHEDPRDAQEGDDVDERGDRVGPQSALAGVGAVQDILALGVFAAAARCVSADVLSEHELRRPISAAPAGPQRARLRRLRLHLLALRGPLLRYGRVFRVQTDEAFAEGVAAARRQGQGAPTPGLRNKEGRATMTRSKARRHQTQSEKDEAAAKALVNQTLEVLTQWRMDQQEAAARTERAVARCKDMITSPTEAVDDILGDCCWDETRSPPQLAKQSAPLDPQATAAENSSTASATTTAQDGGGDGGDGEDSEDEAAASSSSEAGVEVFGWSHSDPFFLFSDSDCLAMGGGSAFALYIEKDLLHGMSDQSSTFGSSVLSSTQNFIVNELEVWVFDDPAEDER